MVSGVPSNAFMMKIVVGDDDIDMQGHVSNLEIVRWMSRAAWAHSTSLGFDEVKYREIGGWFVVRRHEIDYLAPAVEGDRLALWTWPSGLGKVTAERKHHLVRESDGAVIARGVNMWAYIGIESGRPVRMPNDIRDAFDPTRFV